MRAGRLGQRERLAEGSDRDARPRASEDRDTTPTVEPLSAVNVGALGLGTPGVLTVGTLSEPRRTSASIPPDEFSGFDNQLLRAIADKLRPAGPLRRHRLLRAAGPGGVPALRRRLGVDQSYRRAASHRRLHQRLRLRLLLARGAGRLCRSTNSAIWPPASASAWFRAPSRSPTSSTPCICNR